MWLSCPEVDQNIGKSILEGVASGGGVRMGDATDINGRLTDRLGLS